MKNPIEDIADRDTYYDNERAGDRAAAPCSAFDLWWNDQENGCPTLVLDDDEQFARAVWNAAIKAAVNNAEVSHRDRELQPDADKPSEQP